MSRLLKFTVLLSLVAFFVSTGAFGFYTYQARSGNNGLTSGTMYIGKDEKNKGVLDGQVQLDGLLPGEAPREFSLKVKNVGTLDACLNGISATLTDNGDKFMANAVKVTCTGPGGEKFYSGSLLALDGCAVPAGERIVLEPGRQAELKFAFQLDRRAGNWYKGRSLEFSLTVLAGQDPARGPDTPVVCASGDLQAAVDNAPANSVLLVPAGNYGYLHVRRSDVAIRARDVVFDTVLAGAVFEAGAARVALQGFTVGAGEASGAVLVVADAAGDITVTDNIFCRGSGRTLENGVKTGKARGLVLKRNDFSELAGSPLKDPRITGQGFKKAGPAAEPSQLIEGNLGLDLDPATQAL